MLVATVFVCPGFLPARSLKTIPTHSMCAIYADQLDSVGMVLEGQWCGSPMVVPLVVSRVKNAVPGVFGSTSGSRRLAIDPRRGLRLVAARLREGRWVPFFSSPTQRGPRAPVTSRQGGDR